MNNIIIVETMLSQCTWIVYFGTNSKKQLFDINNCQIFSHSDKTTLYKIFNVLYYISEVSVLLRMTR